MLLRDPIHGLVAFEDQLETLVLALMDTREVQRLRRIRQLGLSSLVFPGAEHTRFSHAIGTAHVMRKLIARLRRVENELPVHLRVDAHLEVCAVAAALVHDLGHGPFSHLFEEVLPHQRRHETWTRMIVESETTDVHRALLQFGADTPGEVVKLLNGTHRCAWLSRWISGVIDVDRCDYLLRDSQMAGVAYGIYDLDWLFEALTFAELPCKVSGRGDGPFPPTGKASSEPPIPPFCAGAPAPLAYDSIPRDSRWSVVIEGRKGLPPLEGFFLARHFMYGQVYHHKATRAAKMEHRLRLR